MLKTLICIGCGDGFLFDHRAGAAPQRCEPCRIVRKKETDRAKAARWRAANVDRAREQWNRHNRKRLADPEHLRWKREDAMRRAYGMEPAEFAVLLASQDGRCAVCGGPPCGPGRRLHVDHCHSSATVRGLLCAKCNTAIGLLDDDPERASAVAAYLRR